MAVSEAADAAWTAARARVELARAVAAASRSRHRSGDLPRRRAQAGRATRAQGRESVFDALAGCPVTAALLGLATIAEARGDRTAADELRASAGLTRP